MSAPGRFDRLVGRYPARWRARYGDELVALLEDTYGDGPVPNRQRLSMLRGALVEHGRLFGLTSDAGSPQRVRAGALLVLCAWAVFMVTGSAFAKYLEHWALATPAAARRIPADAVTAVTVAAVLAVILVAVGALALAVPVARSVRAEGWDTLGRAIRAAGLLVSAALVATALVVLVAHSRTGAGGHGKTSVPLFVGGVWAAILLAALAASVRAAMAAARRVELRGALLRVEAISALGVFLCMVVVLAGTAIWWAAIALHAPGFLQTSLGPVGTWGSVVPPVMLGIAGGMLVALTAATVGALQILGALRSAGRTT